MAKTRIKVTEGIHSTTHDKSFGLSMLKSIEKTYKEFEDELNNRKELNEYLQYDLEEYKHAIRAIETYLNGDDTNMKESDARIYQFYIREKHLHFVEIAKEIDDEYNQKI